MARRRRILEALAQTGGFASEGFRVQGKNASLSTSSFHADRRVGAGDGRKARPESAVFFD
jgi:hypothetical protein